MESSSCFMCGQKAEHFHYISETGSEQELGISNIICQHFWFQEDVLRTAIICEPCWQTVSQFHRYYQDVKQYHEQLLEPNSICIKQEPLDSIVEVEPSRIEAEVSSDEEESKVGIAEKCNQLSEEANPVVVEKLTRSKAPSAQQKQMEDNFIKKHFPYNCNECSVQFECYISMRRHMIDVHGKAYIMCCGVQYTSRYLLFQHVQAVLNPEAFKCKLCDRSYTLRTGYVRHMHRRHPNNDPFRCDQCPKRFPSADLLNRHTANHNRFTHKIIKCHICGQRFGRKLRLREHMIAVHEKTAVYVCEICSKSFTRLEMFKEHQMTHEFTAEELKKQCPICKRWQKNERLWKNHVDRHKGDGARQCDQCDFVSINSSALKRHIERMHDKKMDCPCEVCGKVYANPKTLKEHVANSHTKEPLYQCRFCEETFFTSSPMYKHRKKAHPKEWQEYITSKFGIDEAEARAEKKKAGNFV
nr:transcription factor grauzone-like [Aedes albopictus]